jgi:hypothetical protein
MPNFQLLEPVGDAVQGDQINLTPQTPGGASDMTFTRTFRVNSQDLPTYLVQIIDAPTPIVDYQYPNAYLVQQQARRHNDIDVHLLCVFAQVPSPWAEDGGYAVETFPGVARSSLYPPDGFPWRNSSSSFETQIRREHSYQLGSLSGCATFPRFAPVDAHGNRVSVLTDYTSPSVDTWIAMVYGRQEIVVSSTASRWRGPIWEIITRYAVCQ